VVEERQDVPRFYKLAYLITAWTQRPEDEHRLLSAILATLMTKDLVPEDHVPDILKDVGIPLGLTIAYPPPENRQVSDVWSSLGGDLKASVDLVVILPIRPSDFHKLAQAVMEPMRLKTIGEKTIDSYDGVRQLRDGGGLNGPRSEPGHPVEPGQNGESPPADEPKGRARAGRRSGL
jgi:hypothetical protein